jgi:hypothetical protein
MSQIDFIRGNQFDLALTVKENGVAKDITGATVRFTVKKAKDDAADDTSAIISKTVTSHTDPSNGVTAIPIIKSDTQDEDVGSYFYDIQIDFADGSIKSAEGRFSLIKEVTRL